MTAEGIYYAMVSGDLAARAAIETPATSMGSLAVRYRRACDREIGAELRDSGLMQRYLFADRPRIAKVIAGAQSDPDSARAILDYIVGCITYRDMRRKIVFRAPLLAARLAWSGIHSMFASCSPSAATVRVPPERV